MTEDHGVNGMIILCGIVHNKTLRHALKHSLVLCMVHMHVAQIVCDTNMATSVMNMCCYICIGFNNCHKQVPGL